jgi:hypothetical protein
MKFNMGLLCAEEEEDTLILMFAQALVPNSNTYLWNAEKIT